VLKEELNERIGHQLFIWETRFWVKVVSTISGSKDSHFLWREVHRSFYVGQYIYIGVSIEYAWQAARAVPSDNKGDSCPTDCSLAHGAKKY
jgi:hypothetical protein